MLGDLDALVGAGTIAPFGLEHGGLHVNEDGDNERTENHPKARPQCRHGDVFFK